MNSGAMPSNNISIALKKDRPCTWAMYEYGRTLDVKTLRQRLELIDDMIAQLRGKMDIDK